jgi:hypothetical protein
VQTTESFLLLQSIREDVHAASLDRQIADTQASLARLSDPIAATQPDETSEPSPSKSYNPFSYFVHSHDDLRDRLERLQTERKSITPALHTAHKLAFAAVTILPKTSGTTELLVRALSSQQDTEALAALDDDRDRRPGRRESPADRRTVREAMQDDEKHRTATWFIGTSIAFEAVILGIAAWIFCRRDY